MSNPFLNEKSGTIKKSIAADAYEVTDVLCEIYKFRYDPVLAQKAAVPFDTIQKEYDHRFKSPLLARWSPPPSPLAELRFLIAIVVDNYRLYLFDN